MQTVLIPLIQAVVAIILLVILAWIVDRYVPDEGKSRTVLGATCVYVLKATGVWIFVETTWNRMLERREHSPSGNPFSGPIPPRSESAPPPHPTRP